MIEILGKLKDLGKKMRNLPTDSEVAASKAKAQAQYEAYEQMRKLGTMRGDVWVSVPNIGSVDKAVNPTEYHVGNGTLRVDIDDQTRDMKSFIFSRDRTLATRSTAEVESKMEKRGKAFIAHIIGITLEELQQKIDSGHHQAYKIKGGLKISAYNVETLPGESHYSLQYGPYIYKGESISFHTDESGDKILAISVSSRKPTGKFDFLVDELGNITEVDDLDGPVIKFHQSDKPNS